jgi:hypothetical protein
MSEITGRFGVEIELNSLDGRDFIKNPLSYGEAPSGINLVADLVSGLGLECKIQDWGYNHNPNCWFCKPDSSCGMELCSPVLSQDNKDQLFSVLDAISAHHLLTTDERCSFHVHVELPSMEMDESHAPILAWWIKCEHVFLDFANRNRKNNFYCRPIGLMDMFNHDECVSSPSIFKKLNCKHLSANSFHLFNRRRPTLEFRIGEGTKDARFADMWIKTILRFCESALRAGMPSDYLWLRPAEVVEFIDLDDSLREWFLTRLALNARLEGSECFSPKNRSHALGNYQSLLRQTLNNCDHV